NVFRRLPASAAVFRWCAYPVHPIFGFNYPVRKVARRRVFSLDRQRCLCWTSAGGSPCRKQHCAKGEEHREAPCRTEQHQQHCSTPCPKRSQATPATPTPTTESGMTASTKPAASRSESTANCITSA